LQAGAKVGEEHKAPEAGKATTATAAAPSTRRRGVIEKKARQPDAPVDVLDCMERELFQLSPEDVQSHDVKWLKQQILNKKNMELKSGEEMLIYTQFEQWLKDDEPLSKALGQPTHADAASKGTGDGAPNASLLFALSDSSLALERSFVLGCFAQATVLP
jgi:hypothetical protein